MNGKRDLYIRKETNGKSSVHMKGGLWMHAPEYCHGAQDRIRTRRLHILKRVIPKETFTYVKRLIETDLYI